MRVGCCQSDGVGSLKSWQTMKEAYAVRRTVPPSAEIKASIDKLMSRGMVDDPQKMLSELARLGARLIIQRAVEEEFDTWLGRARYERRPERQRGLRNYGNGYRNGFRPRRVQTAEGELEIETPPPAAWLTTSTRWSRTCAIRSDTASAGGQPTCSNARSARSNDAPRRS